MAPQSFLLRPSASLRVMFRLWLTGFGCT